MKRSYLLLILLILGNVPLAAAQTESVVLPSAYRMNTLGGEYQGWNNCGPAL